MLDEPEEMYQYFRAYLASGYPAGWDGPFRPRSIGAVATVLRAPKGTISQVCRRYDWLARADRFDSYMAAAEEAGGYEKAFEIRRAHFRMLAKTRGLVERELDKLGLQSEEIEERTLSGKELAQLMNVIIKYERLLMGESTANVQVKGAWDLDKLDVEELEKLAELEKKALPSGEE